MLVSNFGVLILIFFFEFSYISSLEYNLIVKAFNFALFFHSFVYLVVSGLLGFCLSFMEI